MPIEPLEEITRLLQAAQENIKAAAKIAEKNKLPLAICYTIEKSWDGKKVYPIFRNEEELGTDWSSSSISC